MDRRATPCAVSNSLRTTVSSGIPKKALRLWTAFLISSLNDREIGLPAHSFRLGSEKSGSWTALRASQSGMAASAIAGRSTWSRRAAA